MDSIQKYSFKAVIFDLDGVVTKTAFVHAAAWKATFDEYLRLREKRNNEQFKEFTHQNDYLPFVDGKPRYQGVSSFLESRGINIPFGDPSDCSRKETACGLGNQKNDKFIEILKEKGVDEYPATIKMIRKLRESGVKVGVASSSKNCRYVLESAKIADLFETRVDGRTLIELNLKGKPEGDMFVKAAFNLGVVPGESIVVEDASSGVKAGRNAGFGLVVGLARENNKDLLFENGADIVFSDLKETNLNYFDNWFKKIPPLLFANWKRNNLSCPMEVNRKYYQNGYSLFFGKKDPVFFLDYDGTLTPIVSKPELAVISKEMKEVVQKLSEKYTVAVISGRRREDVENLLGVKNIIYAGSHGFDILGPEICLIQPEVKKIINLINPIAGNLSKQIGMIPGVIIENKKFNIAIHYRLVEDKYLLSIEKVIKEIVNNNKSLRLMSGKKVLEILPAIDWNKGKAVRWIMEKININWEDSSVVYIGDDTTDEDAFRIVKGRGAGILVSSVSKPSSADFLLASSKEVQELFERIVGHA